MHGVVSQVEALLASEDYGKDLASVNNLLKKHQLLEADISAHEVHSSFFYINVYHSHTKVKPPSDWVFCYCNKSVIPNASCLKYSEVLSPYFFCLQDRLKDLNGQADSLMASNAFDTTQVKDKRDAVNGRFAKIKNMAASRRAKLNESHRLHQFFRDLDDEESWIK